MEVDDDLPTAEELEWLETAEEVAPPPPFSPNPTHQPAVTPLKSNPKSSSSKRGRQEQEDEDKDEEEWLRYSPPSQPSAPKQPRRSCTTISRFASEIAGECFPITGPLGDRVYAQLNPSPLAPDGNNAHSHCLLLPHSIHTLTQLAERSAFSKALQDSLHSTPPTGDHHPPEPHPHPHPQLWVDKYAPRSFTDLLSDEHTNREVLLWIKQWDSLVFGSPLRATADHVLAALRIHSSPSANRTHSSFPAKHHHPPSRPPKSSLHQPPDHKVLLLCGPPGLGKTTLAHVAAKHCGYRVVEINASDDRSASSIEAKILDVVQMNSVMPDSKPKCLVIDEIDGALGDGKGAVEVILKMVAAERKGNSEKRDVDEEEAQDKAHAQSRKTSSKKGNKVAKLSRPIICICNDLYAPALRQLRQVAKVHTFIQPTVSRVVNRLKYICMKEGFITNSLALSALAECTECDIRSCLNTLQFLNKNKQPLSIADVDSQVIGRKDMSKSAIDIWKEVFHKKKSKRVRNSVNSQIGQAEDITQHLYSLVSSRGEYELTMDGIHENFLRLSYHDPMMHKTSRCLDMLGTSDFLNNYVMKTQQMAIHAYQPSIAVSMSRLIAQVEKPNIEWPRSFHRCRVMLVEKQETLRTWQRRIAPCISRHISVESFVEDIVSPFLHIIAPPNLRPVALDLLSDREKDVLHQLVDTMVSYSLTYKYSKGGVQEKMHNIFADASEDMPLSLDPPISELVNFKEYQSQYLTLSLATKQILVHEVEQQQMLHESRQKHADRTIDNTRPAPIECLKNANANADADDRKKQAMVLKAVPSCSSVDLKVAPRKPSSRSNSSSKTDFFQRFRKESSGIAETQNLGMGKAATLGRDSRPFLFKYNEGFTNAVKRPVKICDLLQ